MITEHKEKNQHYLSQLPDKHLEEIIEYLKFLQLKDENKASDRNYMLLSEDALAKDWLTSEEEEAWKHH